MIAPFAGPKSMSDCFSIGLNPGLMVIEEGREYRPDRGAGVVWMGIGSNALLGGKNKTQGGFTFPLVKATVEADGKLIVKDGDLAF